MIHCPQCGAANPDGNKLCSECGNVLPSRGSGVLCPMCGHSNPVERETCERCSARLVPLVASSPPQKTPDLTPSEQPSLPVSVPPSGPSFEEQRGEGAPDWLQRMRDSALSGEPTPSEGSAEETAEPPDALPGRPDWLSRLAPSSAEAQPPKRPERPGRVAPASEGVPESEEEPSILTPSEEAEVPDWLAAMRTAEGDLGEEEPAEGLDWLSRLDPMFADMPEGEEVPSIPTPSEEAEVPDWLAAMTAAEGARGEEEPAEGLDWLSRLKPLAAGMPGGKEESTVPTPAEPEVPDWLAELTPPKATPGEAEPAALLPAEPEVPDWLAELAPSEVTPGEAEPVAPSLEEAEEVPDWLEELAPPEMELEEAEPAAPSSEEAEVPDWLSELVPSEVAPVEAEPGAPPPEEAEVPDWLAELAPSEVAPVEAEPVAPPPEEAEEVPDWLAELAPSEVAPVEAEPGALLPEEPEVPDWLEQLVPPETELVEAESAAPPPEEAEVPDWLAAMIPEEAEPVAPLPPEAEVPDWLAEMIAPDEVESVPPTPAVEAELAPVEARPDELEPAGPPPSEAVVPDWLAELSVAKEESVTEELDTATPARVEIPDWLVAPTYPELSEQLVSPIAEPGLSPEESGLAQADIPAWLQALRPDAAPTPTPTEERREVETSGLLAGIAGVVQPATVVSAVPAAPSRPGQISTEATLARARLWQELIARSAQPLPKKLPQVRAKAARDRLLRWLVYGIVLVAVAAPIAGELDLSNIFALDEPLTSETGAAYDLIDEIVAEGVPVLVAFDYDPSYGGELQSQAEALLHHLAQKQARIIAISLVPEGAGLAQQLLDKVLIEQDYKAGEDFANLGYVPGESVGIRSLEFLPQQFQDQAFDGINPKDALVFNNGTDFALSNVSLIVALTGNANNLRWWVEQTTALEQDLEREIPLVAGVSAAIEPLVRPYYEMESRQIDGLIVGLPGAFDYETRLNQSNGPAHIRLSGQLVGQVAVFTLILIGMLVYGLRRSGNEEAA